ncbi:hypothetical protein C1645_805353 [Glomus cerebriforme]|uniref:Uncharacterized protein n=1 Tax=Glomus cerebriforme TaxID=658196 RepID=A0A397SYN8_9GLOM|nr:hypothetical protein C1645_805353 [Glomus cerebriforme]
MDLKVATLLAKESKTLKEKPKRAFSSYLSLSEVLAEYGLDSDDIDSIPLFEPQIHEIQDDNEVFKRCMEKFWALDPNSNSYKSLCNSVKEVLGVIVGLLKDRACAEEEPERKRVRLLSEKKDEPLHGCHSDQKANKSTMWVRKTWRNPWSYNLVVGGGATASGGMKR